jgi:hypothetical protein
MGIKRSKLFLEFLKTDQKIYVQVIQNTNYIFLLCYTCYLFFHGIFAIPSTVLKSAYNYDLIPK